MVEIEILLKEIAILERILKDKQEKLIAAMKKNYKERLHAQKLEIYDDPLYSEEAVNDMRAHCEARVYLTADGKQHWYLVTEEPREYQGA